MPRVTIEIYVFDGDICEILECSPNELRNYNLETEVCEYIDDCFQKTYKKLSENVSSRFVSIRRYLDNTGWNMDNYFKVVVDVSSYSYDSLNRFLAILRQNSYIDFSVIEEHDMYEPVSRRYRNEEDREEIERLKSDLKKISNRNKEKAIEEQKRKAEEEVRKLKEMEKKRLEEERRIAEERKKTRKSKTRTIFILE